MISATDDNDLRRLRYPVGPIGHEAGIPSDSGAVAASGHERGNLVIFGKRPRSSFENRTSSPLVISNDPVRPPKISTSPAPALMS